jgi:hypothetical protein
MKKSVHLQPAQCKSLNPCSAAWAAVISALIDWFFILRTPYLTGLYPKPCFVHVPSATQDFNNCIQGTSQHQLTSNIKPEPNSSHSQSHQAPITPNTRISNMSTTKPTPAQKAEATAYLTSLLNKNLRVTTTDARMFWGTFKCTDPVSLLPSPHSPVTGGLTHLQ